MSARMAFSVHLTAIVLGLVTIRLVLGSCPDVARADWGARAPRDRTNLTLPVAHVVIHHTYQPGACADGAECAHAMRRMQDMHQIGHGWSDIGYNFCVGGDGLVYEGRGWDIVGAHAPKYNSLSIGICFIGDFRELKPSPAMLAASRGLIECGVARGSILAAYKLVGHSQVRATECPGGALLAEIQTWPHWSSLTDIQPRVNATTPSSATVAVQGVAATEATTATTAVETETVSSVPESGGSPAGGPNATPLLDDVDAVVDVDVTSEVTQNNTIDGSTASD